MLAINNDKLLEVRLEGSLDDNWMDILGLNFQCLSYGPPKDRLL